MNEHQQRLTRGSIGNGTSPGNGRLGSGCKYAAEYRDGRTILPVVLALLLLFPPSFSRASNPDHGKAWNLVYDEHATRWAKRPKDLPESQPIYWSDPASWEDRNGDGIGDPPVAGSRVVIPAGITVTQDVDSPKLKTLRVDGTLQPAGNVTLLCETVVVTEGGKLSAGTSTVPFEGNWRIVFADTGPIDTVADPWKFSRGLLALGEVKLYGREVTAYREIEGVAAGATQISLSAAATGWKAGDRIVIPGVQWATQDDDERAIAGIDGAGNISLASGLSFNHSAVDREGFPRPMVAANITPRSIHFESENPAIDRRGHLMFMCGGNVLSHVSGCRLGRTNKALPLTDPDGLGGGLANERGRYGGPHFHRAGPDITKMESLCDSCVFWDSPGWLYVNHESFVSFLNCVGYRAFGSAFTGENGNETGWISDCLAIRSTINPASGAAGNDLDDLKLADWGRFGHGIWTHGGGIKISRFLAFGMAKNAVEIMGKPFRIGVAPPVLFETKNLPKPLVWNPPSGHTADKCPANFVPQDVEGVRWVGCNGGVKLWELNRNGGGPPPIGRSRLKDSAGESDNGVVLGYLSNVDLENVRCTAAKDGKGVGFGHTGVNSEMTYSRCAAHGFATGINCPTTGTNSISDCTLKCQVGIHLNNGRGDRPLLNMERLTFLPNGKPGQLGIESRVFLSPTYLRTSIDVAGNLFATYTSSTPSFAPGDAVKLDGRYLYLSEEASAFPLSLVKNCPLPLKTLTTQQLWDTHRLTFCNRRIPADATVLPGSDCLVSDNPSVALPQVRPNKSWGTGTPYYYQQTNQQAGFVLRVKDATGSFVEAPPVDLVPGWNVVKTTVGGVERGVMIFCNPTGTFVPAW